MTTLVVVLIRAVVPFSVLRWPLWGAIACIIADMDVVLVTLLWRYVPHFGDIWNLAGVTVSKPVGGVICRVV